MEKGGGWKTSRNDTPSQKGVLDPPSYGTFSTPLRCQCSVFPVQKSTTEQTRSSFGGVQNFSGERVLWYVSPPPPIRFAPPHITAQDRVHAIGVVLCEKTCFCLLSAFHKKLPSKNPSKNLVFTENPYRRLLRTLLRSTYC